MYNFYQKKQASTYLKRQDKTMERIEQTRPNTRKGVIMEDGEVLPHHKRGEFYGIEWVMWKCIDNRLNTRIFNLLRMRWKDTKEVIPGKKKVRASFLERRYREVPLHFIRKDVDNPGSVYDRCFRLYFRRLVDEREDHLSSLQETIRGQLEEKLRELGRKARKRKRKRYWRSRAAKMYGCSEVQVKSYMIDAVKNMGNRMARNSVAH